MARTYSQWLIGTIFLIMTQSAFGAVVSSNHEISTQGAIMHQVLDDEKFAKNIENKKLDENVLNWIRSNVSPETGLMLSFHIPENQKLAIYSSMGESDSIEGIIERVIVEEGLDVYDGAVGQMALILSGDERDLELALRPIEIYWSGELGNLSNIRAGYPINNFIYDEEHPEAVSSNLRKEGERGFIYRIVNAHGRYNTKDPLDNKTYFEGFPNWPTVHWEDWKPVAGENAWVSMAALQLYHKKYYNPETKTYNGPENAIELKLAEELARAAIMLQADVGGIRMAPLGTYRNKKDFIYPTQKQGTWWYTQISSENNVSWYAALRMLYQITKKPEYEQSFKMIEDYFQKVWSEEKQYFYQGMHFENNEWHVNDDDFALDVQTWAIIAFGPEMIDNWIGKGSAYRLLNRSLNLSGYIDDNNRLLGVGYIEEHDRLSVEWTAGAIYAAYHIIDYYRQSHPQWSVNMKIKAEGMRKGIEMLRTDLSPTQSGYSYSSKRGWIPFGWNSHESEVLSLASTGWVLFIDNDFNPFYLPEN